MVSHFVTPSLKQFVGKHNSYKKQKGGEAMILRSQIVTSRWREEIRDSDHINLRGWVRVIAGPTSQVFCAQTFLK